MMIEREEENIVLPKRGKSGNVLLIRQFPPEAIIEGSNLAGGEFSLNLYSFDFSISCWKKRKKSDISEGS